MTLQTSGPISLANIREEFIGLIKDPYPTDIYFKPDGTKLYVLGGGNEFNAIDTIYAYDLSIAYDISTITFSGKIYLGYEQSVLYGIGLFFKPDGTKMYIVDKDGFLYEFNLSTAWDVTTAAFSESKYLGTSATGLFFKPDGTKLYTTSVASNLNVLEYNMSTAWDISTLTSFSGYDPTISATSPQGIFFKPDGTKMYVLFISDARIYEFNLSTAWSVSTAAYATYATISFGAQATGISFNSTGTKLYTINTTTDGVDSYNIVSAWTFVSGVTQSISNTFPQTAYSLSEFYRGGAYVFGIAENLSIPTSGAISISNFYGTKKYIPFSTKVTFTADTTFTVPTGVTSIRIKAWGGGGGDSAGGAGFAKAEVTVTPGDTLAIRIGGGGKVRYGSAGSTDIVANGGGRGYVYVANAGIGVGGGGGYSGVFSNNTISQANALVIAAGSGGGAKYASGAASLGGAGGGTSGNNGTGASPGTGGTQSAGGSVNGAALVGGNGSNSGTYPVNGGGGGGYFGGGGGSSSTLATSSGGGGGSSYIKAGATNTGIISGAVGPGGLAPTSDTDYVTNVGKGGSQGAAGNAGYVVIYW